VVDAGGVERPRAALNAVHDVALAEQEFGSPSWPVMPVIKAVLFFD
jgi:hypothetical protein